MDFPWTQILPLIGQVFLRVLTEPFFWMVILLVWYLYQRMQKTKESLYGLNEPALRVAAVSVVNGLIGGLVGSFVMIFFGISINDVGIGYLWLLALVLMLFSPRFLCFSYAGGLLAVVSLLTGQPRVNIPALMGLVAVLHLVESVLILTSGHIDPLPVYVRNETDRVVGAFNLQKFWPIPLAVLMVTGVPHQITGEIIKTPDWWPLIHPLGAGKAQDLVYGIFPVVAALGYGELAITRLPREKVRRSAFHLALFSLVLLGLSVYASRVPQAAVLPALFSPLGHELVIYVGRREEFQGKPRFVPPRRGMMVLDVIKGSPAAAAGLHSGDVIYSVEEFPVNSRDEFIEALDFAGTSFSLLFASGTGLPRRVRVTLEANASFGVIPVPEPGDLPNVNYVMGSPLRNLARRLFKR